MIWAFSYTASQRGRYLRRDMDWVESGGWELIWQFEWSRATSCFMMFLMCFHFHLCQKDHVKHFIESESQSSNFKDYVEGMTFTPEAAAGSSWMGQDGTMVAFGRLLFKFKEDTRKCLSNIVFTIFKILNLLYQVDFVSHESENYDIRLQLSVSQPFVAWGYGNYGGTYSSGTYGQVDYNNCYYNGYSWEPWSANSLPCLDTVMCC